LVCFDFFDFLYASFLPCIFAPSLFIKKVYEVVLWRFNNPHCVEGFCLLKENKKILSFAPLFYSFQNLVVHRVALTSK
jgi:hypothetical protein